MHRRFWGIYHYHEDEEQSLTDGDCKCINPTLIRTVYIAVQKSRVMPANAVRGIKNQVNPENQR